MKTLTFRNILCFLICVFFVSSFYTYSQNQKKRPPEYSELIAAMKIEDLNARIKGLERIKVKYPNSRLLGRIDSAINMTKIGLCTEVKPILDLQKSNIETTTGLRRIFSYYYSSLDILKHQNISQFDKTAVTQAIKFYAEEGRKLLKNPEFIKKIPSQQKQYLTICSALPYIAEAMAYLNEDNPKKSMEALDKYKENEGPIDKAFYYTLASTNEKLGEIKEAFENYFSAAAENYEDSMKKSKDLYKRIYGSMEGFENKLEAKLRELPFHPEHFQPTSEWKGKTVLAELFTGSECPPCVAADLGFDGLIDAYDTKYLAVLEYHLPIPRPDPIMNHATKKRASYYGVKSTPTTFFDGEDKHGGGGGRSRGKFKFNQYTGEIKSRINEAPEVRLTVGAALNGEDVKIEYTVDKEIENADYNIVLVQKEEKYRGSNGIVFHKMVVREFISLDPASLKTGQLKINIPEVERAGATRLADYEKERSFQFKEKHYKIDSSNLRVVFFVQNKETKKVFNAAVSDVK